LRRKLIKKILVYGGTYQIRNVVWMNAYELADLDGQSIEVFNSRQLRPHREARLREREEDKELQEVPQMNIIKRMMDNEKKPR